VDVSCPQEQEVQLLVGGGDEKVLAVVILALAVDLAVIADDAVALLLAERWIGEDDFVAMMPPCFDSRSSSFT
jgi:hypothetical protein